MTTIALPPGGHARAEQLESPDTIDRVAARE
jgi:hypothetical protein